MFVKHLSKIVILLILLISAMIGGYFYYIANPTQKVAIQLKDNDQYQNNAISSEQDLSNLDNKPLFDLFEVEPILDKSEISLQLKAKEKDFSYLLEEAKAQNKLSKLKEQVILTTKTKLERLEKDYVELFHNRLSLLGKVKNCRVTIFDINKSIEDLKATFTQTTQDQISIQKDMSLCEEDLYGMKIDTDIIAKENLRFEINLKKTQENLKSKLKKVNKLQFRREKTKDLIYKIKQEIPIRCQEKNNLFKKIAKNSDELEFFNLNLNKIRNEKSELENYISNLKSKIIQFHLDEQEIQAKQQIIEKQLNEEKSKLNTLEEDLTIENRLIKTYSNNKLDNNEKIRLLRDKILQDKKEEKRLKDLLHLIDLRIKKYSAETVKKRMNFTLFEEEKKNFLKEGNQLQSLLVSSKNNKVELLNDLEKLEDNLQNIKKRLFTKKKDLEELQTHYQFLCSKIDEISLLQKDEGDILNSWNKEKFQLLDDDKKVYKEKVDSLSNEVAQLTSQYECLLDDISLAKNKQLSLSEEIRDNQKKLNDSSQKLSHVENIIIKITGELEALNYKYKEEEREKEKINLKIDQKKNLEENYKKNIVAIQQSNENLILDIQELKLKTKKVESYFDEENMVMQNIDKSYIQNTAVLNKLINKKTDVLKEIANLEQHIVKLNGDVNKSFENLENYQNEFIQLQKTKKGIDVLLITLNEGVENNNKKLNSFEMQLAKLLEEVELGRLDTKKLSERFIENSKDLKISENMVQGSKDHFDELISKYTTMDNNLDILSCNIKELVTLFDQFRSKLALLENQFYYTYNSEQEMISQINRLKEVYLKVFNSLEEKTLEEKLWSLQQQISRLKIQESLN
jgi:chromosome segregation ATPase